MEYEPGKLSWSFEAFVVGLADEIAQRHHDLEDGLLAKIMTEDEVVQTIGRFFRDFIDSSVEDKLNFEKMYEAKGQKIFTNLMSRFIVNFLVNQLLETSVDGLTELSGRFGLNKEDSFEQIYRDLNPEDMSKIIDFQGAFYKAHKDFAKHLQKRILNSFSVQRMDGNAQYVIGKLFKAYLTNPQQLPDATVLSLYKNYCPDRVKELFDMYVEQGKQAGVILEELKINTRIIGDLRKELEQKQNEQSFKLSLIRIICDYIAGMTDSYALREYQQLYAQKV